MAVRDRVRRRRFNGAAGDAVVTLMVTADRIERAFEAVLQRHGITGDQYKLLHILRGAHPKGRARSEVARQCIRRSPDLTRMLDRLARAGLVARVGDPDDHRRSVARITKAGLALLARIDPELRAEARRLTRPLGKTQLRQLARLCDTLGT
jgi:DNA-binding MarR family transcriptional regulator